MINISIRYSNKYEIYFIMLGTDRWLSLSGEIFSIKNIKKYEHNSFRNAIRTLKRFAKDNCYTIRKNKIDTDDPAIDSTEALSFTLFKKDNSEIIKNGL